MVERGEITQQDAQRLVNEIRHNRPQLIRRSVHKASETVLDTANFPSKTDIQSLHAEIAALSAKLDQLGGAPQEATAAVLPKVETGKPTPPKSAGKP